MDPAYLEELYRQWLAEPAALDESWQLFFQGFDLASCPRDCIAGQQASDQSRVASLIYAYRDQGHRLAQLDPLARQQPEFAPLAIEEFGFTDADLDRVFDTGHTHLPQRASLREILEFLQQTYCRHVGVEYLHIQDREIRRWLQAEMEPVRNRPALDAARQHELIGQLVDAELFETFVQRRYLGQKRFSVEGAETLIPLLHWIVEQAPETGVLDIMLGMAHRGRLNVLANILDKSYATIFAEFEDNYIPGTVAGDGDVKYHKGFSSIRENRNGKALEISLTANPSHLEAVGSVVLGRARAKQRQRQDTEYRRKVLPVIIHGDAAFAGQGVVAETFNLSRLSGYQVGGTIHVVVNNQIGFTTLPGQARSSLYATDVAKMVEAPIFHVNGDDPEAAVYVAGLALRYRQHFGRDVVIDLVCFRRQGHSEVDEPGYTQPDLYRDIVDHPSVRQIYTRQLIESGALSPEDEHRLTSDFEAKLEQAYLQAKEGVPDKSPDCCDLEWTELNRDWSNELVATGVDHETLVKVATALSSVPDGFAIHPKMARLLQGRLEPVTTAGAIDWALAEQLAFGSLLVEGFPVRLSGQDSERGTFSQRHAVWRDERTAEPYIPLNHIAAGQARFCVYNSPLSEASVLGFEYGYSLAEPHMLLAWEAQFGDFANGAQVVIDQFLVAARSKWQRDSGLVLLLPHGYEGQGPEHSNAYLERYLAACAEENIQVCYPSTPAQYFHLLRRQLKRSFRRPLVVMTPKSMLRNRVASSPVGALVEDRFREVLADPAEPARVHRLVLCSGKVYYDLLAARTKAKVEDVALVRVEQLYPFPSSALEDLAARWPEAELRWAQEEPQNRGAWTYLAPRLEAVFRNRDLRYVGRRASASPAVGSLRVHRQEQAALVAVALGVEEEDPGAARIVRGDAT
jgi:2-oxoglutarate dehydrogenase E1 component